MRVAVLFPGQGSQFRAMADPWTSHEAGRRLLDEVSELWGRDVVELCRDEAAPRQIVLSGSTTAVEHAEELARTKGAKAIRLRVAGAFHSPLMRPALDRVREAISRLQFREPRMAVVPNASGRPTREPSALRDLLSRHLVSPGRWERSIRAPAESGVGGFVEAGPEGGPVKAGQAVAGMEPA